FFKCGSARPQYRGRKVRCIRRCRLRVPMSIGNRDGPPFARAHRPAALYEKEHLMKRAKYRLSGLLAVLAVTCLSYRSTDAVVIMFDALSLGGSNFRYVYTLFNNEPLGPVTSIQLFDIDFEPSRYNETSL